MAGTSTSIEAMRFDSMVSLTAVIPGPRNVRASTTAPHRPRTDHQEPDRLGIEQTLLVVAAGADGQHPAAGGLSAGDVVFGVTQQHDDARFRSDLLPVPAESQRRRVFHTLVTVDAEAKRSRSMPQLRV